jgi:hypothetical protein
MNVFKKLAAANEKDFNDNINGTSIAYSDLSNFMINKEEFVFILDDLECFLKSSLKEANNFIKILAFGFESSNGGES